MTAVNSDHQEQQVNHPIDVVEEMVAANEWAFERTGDDEIVAEIPGTSCLYRLYFVWQPDLAALYFSCIYDMRVPEAKRSRIHELLALTNEKMWVGHFEMTTDEGVPMFRQTLLLRGLNRAPIEQMEDLVDIAMTECERFYPAFQFTLWGGRSAKEALDGAILETVGEA